MKKVLAITLMLLLLATAAMCAENNWRITIKADNGAGASPSPGASLGVYPTSLEGLDFQDGSVYGGIGADTPGTAMHVAAVVPGQVGIYGKSIKAFTIPETEKTWDFFVAANVNSTAPVIRLRAYTVSSTTYPPAFLSNAPAIPVKYYIRMLDNQGKEGAPANGFKWELPIPTVHSSTVPFWDSPINLPVIVLSSKSNDALAAEGYKLQLVQEQIIPEPSSLLALGAGLMGLAGFVSRRRRA